MSKSQSKWKLTEKKSSPPPRLSLRRLSIIIRSHWDVFLFFAMWSQALRVTFHLVVMMSDDAHEGAKHHEASNFSPYTSNVNKHVKALRSKNIFCSHILLPWMTQKAIKVLTDFSWCYVWIGVKLHKNNNKTESITFILRCFKWKLTFRTTDDHKLKALCVIFFFSLWMILLRQFLNWSVNKCSVGWGQIMLPRLSKNEIIIISNIDCASTSLAITEKLTSTDIFLHLFQTFIKWIFLRTKKRYQQHRMMVKATHTSQERKAWIIELEKIMRTIKTTSTRYFEGRVSIQMKFYVFIGDWRWEYFNWITTNLRFLHPRLLSWTIENDTLLTSLDSSLYFCLNFFLSSLCFFFSLSKTFANRTKTKCQ